ncbi:pre-peptidase C-terminal domain-containing protein [Laspinema sp. D1]|uniref:Pre-peptidase C-terminal domain-containing protein n=1 Tax=Laspinema palackyanum D2a TaxID=2953684 RepID=A0ABT2MLN5_9CYAN|nr:pre-peptidase C-terminal domain-containing protein [Laspinema sp. D2b]MCT7965659.1 pre-peptidase C-terminal domain-containing protein [Laspinema sp. D2a]
MAVNLLDPDFYRAANQDLRGLNNQQALEHLVNFGLNEGRVFSPAVDLDFYRRSNPGLGAVGLTTRRQLYDHLSNFGVRENRPFSLVFNPAVYNSRNPDLAAAGVVGSEALFNHYQNFGIREGRSSAIAFDTKFYESVNPDLRQAGLNNRQLVEHFQFIGANEGRTSSPNFNVRFYLAANPDLNQAFGFNFRQAFEHYLSSGIPEGRVATPGGTPLPPLPPPPLPPGPPVPAGPGNTPQTALNAGVLTGVQTFNQSISNTNPNDYYRFSLSGPTNLNVVINGTTQDANLELFLDSNNDGVVNATERVGLSTQPGTLQDSVTGFFTAGNYFVNVSQAVTGAETAYNLNLIGTPVTGDVGGNSPNTSANLGILSGTRRIDDLVGNADPQDYFRFVLNDVRNVNLLLTGLNDDADLRLYQTVNNNGAIEQGNLIAQSIQSGTTPEALSRSLTPGDYLVLVSPGFQGVNTNYSLTLSA